MGTTWQTVEEVCALRANWFDLERNCRRAHREMKISEYQHTPADRFRADDKCQACFFIQTTTTTTTTTPQTA